MHDAIGYLRLGQKHISTACLLQLQTQHIAIRGTVRRLHDSAAASCGAKADQQPCCTDDADCQHVAGDGHQALQSYVEPAASIYSRKGEPITAEVKVG